MAKKDLPSAILTSLKEKAALAGNMNWPKNANKGREERRDELKVAKRSKNGWDNSDKQAFPVYRMHQLDPLNDDRNLLLNLRELILHYNEHDAAASVASITSSDSCVNSFHPFFNKVFDGMSESEGISQAPGTYIDFLVLIDKALKESYDQQKFMEQADEAVYEELYEKCASICRTFINGYITLRTEDGDCLEKFEKLFSAFYRDIKTEIGKYENSPKLGYIEKMEYLSKNVKIMIGNVYHKRFQAYCTDEVSFNDVVLALYRMIAKR